MAKPFPPRWFECLEQNVHYYQLLPEHHKTKLHNLIKVFIAETHWEGCGGQEVDDDIRVTIAAGACLLVLGIEPTYFYNRVKTILVYPDTYYRPQHPDSSGLVSDEVVPMYGESWHHGPIVLAWQVVLRNLRNPGDGQNLVLHEFAHHLDGLDGYLDGIPPLARQTQQGDFRQVTEAAFQRLVHNSMDGRATLLDQYGATDRAEFFAVATECFFERPQALAQRHPDLYDVMRGFYRQHPAEWQM